MDILRQKITTLGRKSLSERSCSMSLVISLEVVRNLCQSDLLQGEKWREVLLDENDTVSYFHDEAHCIVKW